MKTTLTSFGEKLCENALIGGCKRLLFNVFCLGLECITLVRNINNY